MLKRFFPAPRPPAPRATRPVALSVRAGSGRGPIITLRDLARHLALIGPPAETLRLQTHLATQMLTRQLPVTTLCLPHDPDRPALPPPALTLTASPDLSAEHLARQLRHALERHTTATQIPTNLLLYPPHLPLRLASDLTDLMRLWHSCALYTFTPEQLLSTRMAPYRSKLNTLFASALIFPSALRAYQAVSGAPLGDVPAKSRCPAHPRPPAPALPRASSTLTPATRSTRSQQ